MGSIRKSIKGFMGPAKYIQGQGLMEKLGDYKAAFGNNIVAFIDEFLYDSITPQLNKAYPDGYQPVSFTGQVSLTNAQKYIEIGKASGADVIVGIGGGRTMDMAKLVANEIDAKQVIIPTSASTDAPTSALSVIYTETGEHSHEIFYDKGPDLVLVDTDIIAAAPLRLLIAGMGDALATLFEARANLTSDSTTNMKGEFKQTLAAYAIAKECYNVLISDGYAALQAARVGAVTPALDNIIEVNTLLSGIGAETNGASGSHAFHDGFTVLEECHGKLHGEKVSFGVVCQLVLENRPKEELEEVLNFACSVGLPVCMADLGVKQFNAEQARAVAKAVMESPLILRECLDVNEELIYSTVLAADQIGNDYKNAFGGK